MTTSDLPTKEELDRLERQVRVFVNLRRAEERYLKIVEQTGGKLPELAGPELRYMDGYFRCLATRLQLESTGRWEAFVAKVAAQMRGSF